MACMPYNEADYRTQPISAQKATAAAYKLASWEVIGRGDISTMKKYLANNYAIVAPIPVYEQFYDLSRSAHIYNSDAENLDGYHAICLVGYDESKKL